MDATKGRYVTTLFQRLAACPLWAIRPEHVAAMILNALNPKTDIEAGTVFSTWVVAAKPSMLGKAANRVAVIPIQGVLTSDGPSWLGTNYRTITDAAEQAGADASVKRVVLAVDSPGGEVNGLPETAAVIAQLAKIKPVSAMVEGDAASAAYWLTSQATDITLTPSGEVGSVGVRMMHMDISKYLEDAGVKVTELFSGQYKTEFSPYAPLSDEAKADMQQRLDAIHTDFISAVASGRGNRAAGMQEARFGEGRMFSSPVAFTAGLVDGIQPARDFYRAITHTEEEAPAITPPRRARVEVERAKAKRA